MQMQEKLEKIEDFELKVQEQYSKMEVMKQELNMQHEANQVL